MKLRCREHVLDLERTAIMGVLNVTPDSFSDGGLWVEPQRALEHAREMIEEGAAIVDVGGESTRPGSAPVTVEEEVQRVLPIVEALARDNVPVSIDTRKPSVARAALEAGASLINDTCGEEVEPDMDAIAAEFDAAVCIMHSRGTPATMRELIEYGDVVTDVKDFLGRRAEDLLQAGVSADAICLDPGIGFAKSVEQNLVLLKRLPELTDLPYPVLVGTSRKSFIGHVLGLDVEDRIEGTAATVALSVMGGARILRVHDVRQMNRVIRMTEAILQS